MSRISRLLKVSGIMFVLTGLFIGYHGYQTVQDSEFGVQDRGGWMVEDGDVAVNSSFWVDYRGPVDLDFDWVGAELSIRAADTEIVSGGKDGVVIEKDTNSTVTLVTDLSPENLAVWWPEHIGSGEVSGVSVYTEIDIDHPWLEFSYGDEIFTHTLETGIEDTLNNALEGVEDIYRYDSGYPGEEKIEVVAIDLELGDVDEDVTELVFTADIRNLNDYPIPSPGFEGSLSLNRITLLDWDRQDVNHLEGPADGVIAPGEVEAVKFSVDMGNQEVPDWFVSHVDRDEYTEGELELNMFFDFQDAGVLTVPADGMSCRFEFATAILVKQDSYSDSESCESRGGVRYEGEGMGVGIGSDSEDVLEDLEDEENRDEEDDLFGIL